MMSVVGAAITELHTAGRNGALNISLAFIPFDGRSADVSDTLAILSNPSRQNRKDKLEIIQTFVFPLFRLDEYYIWLKARAQPNGKLT